MIHDYMWPVACVAYSWHSTTPTRTPTRPTWLQSYVRHTLFPREDPRQDVRVGVGVGVVDCELNGRAFARDPQKVAGSNLGRSASR